MTELGIPWNFGEGRFQGEGGQACSEMPQDTCASIEPSLGQILAASRPTLKIQRNPKFNGRWEPTHSLETEAKERPTFSPALARQCICIVFLISGSVKARIRVPESGTMEASLNLNGIYQRIPKRRISRTCRASASAAVAHGGRAKVRASASAATRKASADSTCLHQTGAIRVSLIRNSRPRVSSLRFGRSIVPTTCTCPAAFHNTLDRTLEPRHQSHPLSKTNENPQQELSCCALDSTPALEKPRLAPDSESACASAWLD